MKARFNGKCVECGEAIKVGKEIVKNSNEKWVHKACSDLEEELPQKEQEQIGKKLFKKGNLLGYKKDTLQDTLYKKDLISSKYIINE